MKNKYLKRVTFLGENKMMVDGEHEVIIKPNSNKKFIFNGKNGKKGFSNEDELFDYVDEMTDTGSVGGGMELPFSTISKSNLNKRKAAPYNKVVTGLYTESEAIEIAEQMVKEALIKEFVVDNNFPAAKIVKSYKDANKKESEKSIKDVENGIKITYEKPLAAFPPNYYRDAKPNDYNGDGVPNYAKVANNSLDLEYDHITDEAKDWFSSQVGDKKVAGDMIKASTKKKEISSKNPAYDGVYFGNDVELNQVKTEKGADSLGSKRVAAMGFNLNENKMYKFTFKDEKYDFGKNRNQLAEAIPNKVKQDNTKFQMADSKGNVFMMEWSEGNATILEHRNLIAEQKLNEKVEKLFTYNNKERKNKPQRIDFDYFTKNKSED